MDTEDLKNRCGPWAVITGASDGTGSAFARQLAGLGIDLVLIARRLGPLNELAEELGDDYGVKSRIASIDLFNANAGKQVLAAAEGLDIGLFVSNAGSDPNGSAFLTAPYRAWQDLLNRNIAALTEPCYGLAQAMEERGRGGIIVMSSGAALGGQPGGAVYSATKAFGLNFAESLYSELQPQGVDVLGAVCPAMNTPSLRGLLDAKGLDVSGLWEPDDVVSTLLDNLGKKPVHIFPFQGNDEEVARIEKERAERLTFMEEMAKMFYGEV